MGEDRVDDGRLFELYKIAIEEYRFQVQLNWDRTKQLIVLNAAILSVGVGLRELPARSDTLTIALFIFLIGSFVAGISIHITNRGHEYYRRTVYKKSLLAEELGFNEKLSRHKSPEATIDVATLANSAKKTEIIKDPEVYFNKRLKQDSVTQLLIYFFGLLLFIDVLYLVAASIAILRV